MRLREFALGVFFPILGWGCVSKSENESLHALPKVYDFPASFYVEQNLTVETPSGTKHMVGQVERLRDGLALVLTDGLTGIVFTKVELNKDQPPKVLYLAPMLIDKKFPGEQIAEAIQYLYEAKHISLQNKVYAVKDKAKRWTYTWQNLRGDAPCQFPEDISLTFKDGPFKVTITLKELDCSVKDKGR
ncbi:MAG: hypothetical protein H7249_05520 [Chitinophagaceae bacterium]|nr:hypothetical protein [Oligoflexus sp.]